MESTQENNKKPTDFLNQIIGQQVVVRLNSGIDYKGSLSKFNIQYLF
jgi:U6 snRNA-associated Sm-like protein LSm6